MVLLYSLEYGKISVQAKGVRKATAKLKFACEPFCFGTYELAQTADRYTLKTCEQSESFYSIREDIVRYYAACCIAECLVNYTEIGQSEPKIFVILLKSLQELVNNVQPLIVLLKFVLDFLELDGFKLDLSRCSVCEKIGKLFLDFERGGVVCDGCRTANSTPIIPKVVTTCKMLDGLPFDKLKNLNIPLDTLKDCLAVCQKYLSHSFFPLKTLTELLKLA